MLKRCFLRCFLFILFIVSSSATYGKQTAYLINSNGFDYIKKMLGRGVSTELIRTTLTRSSYIQKITHILANETFHMEWLEDDRPLPLPKEITEQPLPRLIIAHMGENAGYGLLAMDPIPQGSIIAEYTGTVITDPSEFSDNPYIVHAPPIEEGQLPRQIDAQHTGNAVRFAQHAPSKDELPKYNIDPSFIADLATRRSSIATANSALFPTQDGRMILIAIRDIQPFEPITYNYGPNYAWHIQPSLFDTAGNIIPSEVYTPLRTLIILNEEDAGREFDTRSSTIIANNATLREHIDAHSNSSRTFTEFLNDDGSMYQVNRTKLLDALAGFARTIIMQGTFSPE